MWTNHVSFSAGSRRKCRPPEKERSDIIEGASSPGGHGSNPQALSGEKRIQKTRVGGRGRGEIPRALKFPALAKDSAGGEIAVTYPGLWTVGPSPSTIGVFQSLWDT